MATASAVTNTYAVPGLMLTDSYPDILVKNFEKIRARVWNTPMQGEKFFNKINTTLAAYTESGVGTEVDLPPKNADSELIPYTQPSPGHDITFTPLDYRNGIRITRKLRETDQYNVINKMQSGLVRSYELRREYTLADLYNNAFSGDLVADGMYMCDTGHVCKDPSAGTWDNLQTAAALTQATLRLMRLAMKNRVSDEKGFLAPIIMKTLVVPNELEDKAYELMNSPLRPEDSMNAVNFYQGKVKVEVWDWLTSATAHFGLGPIDEFHEVYEIIRVAPSSLSWVDGGNPDIFCQRIRFSMVCGCVCPRNIEGNAGA